MLSIKKFQIKKKEVFESAIVIQKKFRSWVSCKTLGVALLAREIQYRSDVFSILTAEEEFNQEILTKLVGRLIENNIKENCIKCVNNLYNKNVQIDLLENEILNLQREKDSLSPRGVVQGWVPEMSKTVNEKKKLITDLKLSVIFDEGYKVRDLDEKLERKIKVIEETAENRNRASMWRDIVSKNKDLKIVEIVQKLVVA